MASSILKSIYGEAQSTARSVESMDVSLKQILNVTESGAKDDKEHRSYERKKDKRQEQERKREAGDLQRILKQQKKEEKKQEEGGFGLTEAAIVGALGLGAVGAGIAGYIVSPEFRNFMNEKVFDPTVNIIKNFIEERLPGFKPNKPGVKPTSNTAPVNTPNQPSGGVPGIGANFANNFTDPFVARMKGVDLSLSPDLTTLWRAIDGKNSAIIYEDNEDTKKKLKEDRDRLRELQFVAQKKNQTHQLIKRLEKDITKFEKEGKDAWVLIRQGQLKQAKIDFKKAEETLEENSDFLKSNHVDHKKLQRGGGVFDVPGHGQGDITPMMLPSGSFVLNKVATQHMFAEGGMVPTLLEPGEKVFLPGDPMMEMAMAFNNTFSRFATGGIVEAYHADTGSGWAPEGVTDVHGRPLVLSQSGAESFLKAMRNSDGAVKGGDVASAQRSRAKNNSLRGAHPNSTHLYGEGLDASGSTAVWLQNNPQYGWAYGYNHGPGSVHFNYKGGGVGSNPDSVPDENYKTDKTVLDKINNNNNAMGGLLDFMNEITSMLSPLFNEIMGGFGDILGGLFESSSGVTDLPNGPLQTLNPADIDNSEMGLFRRLVAAEAGGEDLLGQALVARSVMNRLALIQSGKVTTGKFLANDKTLTGVIMGSRQYQPISDGRINGPFTESQLQQADEAIKIAENISDLRGRLEASGKNANEITKLVNSTGFRTGYAFNDDSQNVNVTKHGNHFFNTAGNSVMGHKKGGSVGKLSYTPSKLAQYTKQLEAMYNQGNAQMGEPIIVVQPAPNKPKVVHRSGGVNNSVPNLSTSCTSWAACDYRKDRSFNVV